MQNDSAHAAPRPGPELRVDVAVAVQVADAVQWPALWPNPEAVQVPDCVWHQPFPAGLIHSSAAPLDDDHVKPRPRAAQGGGQSRRTAAGDQQIDHVRLASAKFSTLIRVLSSAALSTEKTSAVIHALCTNGSATPSAMTAA